MRTFSTFEWCKKIVEILLPTEVISFIYFWKYMLGCTYTCNSTESRLVATFLLILEMNAFDTSGVDII